RVLVIDARRAWVVEQHVYDQSGKTLLASAVAETHRYYPVEQVSLPELVSIRLPTANIALKINLGAVQINQLSVDRAQLFSMPSFTAYKQSAPAPAAVGTPLPGQGASRPLLNSVMPAAYSPYPNTGYPVTPASAPAGIPSTPVV